MCVYIMWCISDTLCAIAECVFALSEFFLFDLLVR